MEIISKNARQTKKAAEILAQEINNSPARSSGAVVIALQGDLGSGKTTFTQGFASAFGIREKVLSPTFVLMKIYPVRSAPRSGRKREFSSKNFSSKFRHLVHIDCYRLDSPDDLLHLGFREILMDKDAIVLIEWADRIKKLVPKSAVWIRFRHGKMPAHRFIEIYGNF